MSNNTKNIKPFYIYTEKNCLYIKNINESTEKISNNIYAYCANIDTENNIHIVCLDTYGKLVHLFTNNGVWKKKIIHKCFNSLRNVKDIRLYIINKLLNVFIVEKSPISESIYKVTHFYFSPTNYNLKKYSINNIFKEKESIYKLNIDDLSNIVFEYKSKSNLTRNISNNVLIFNYTTKKWTPPHFLMRSNYISDDSNINSSNIKDDIFEYCYSIKYKI